MRGLVQDAWTHARVNHFHYEVCKILADKYDLWEDGMFPVWLSRVVEGVCTDVAEEHLFDLDIDPREIDPERFDGLS